MKKLLVVIGVVCVLAVAVLVARLLRGPARETSQQPDTAFDDSFARPGGQGSIPASDSASPESDVPPGTGSRDEPADDEGDFPDDELGIPVLPQAVPVSRTKSVEESRGVWAATFTTGKMLAEVRTHYGHVIRAVGEHRGHGDDDRKEVDPEIHEFPSDSGLVVTYSLVTEHDRFEVSLHEDLERGVIVIQHLREAKSQGQSPAS